MGPRARPRVKFAEVIGVSLPMGCRLVCAKFRQADHPHRLSLNLHLRGTVPDSGKAHAVDGVEQVDPEWRIPELRHHLRLHQLGGDDHHGRGPEGFERRAQTLDIRFGAPVEEVDVSGRANEAMHSDGVATDEDEVDLPLVEAGDEVEKVGGQSLVIVADLRGARIDEGVSVALVRGGGAAMVL